MIMNKKEYINSYLILTQIRNLKQIVFEVTDHCNLKCKYCGYGEFYENYDTRDRTELPIGKAKLFLDYIINFWKENPSVSPHKYIYIGFYGGEPLLNMKFIKNIVHYLKTVSIPNKEFQFGMTTNAMLLDKYMDFLVENNFSVLISLDGNKYNHSYRVDHTGRNSYNRVISNIELLRNKYPSFFTSNINFNAVLHNRNSVSETFGFINNKYNKIPSMGELNTTGIKPEMHKKFWKTYKNKEESLQSDDNYEELHKDLFLESPETRKLTFFIQHYSGNVFNTYNDLFIDNEKIETIPTGTCLPFGKKVFITVNGKILPCERIGHNYPLGSISEKDVLIDFNEIADRYNTWLAKFEKQCSMCYNNNACPVCMFTIPNIDSNPVCKQFMDKKSFERSKQANLSYLKDNPELYKRIMENVIITS